MFRLRFLLLIAMFGCSGTAESDTVSFTPPPSTTRPDGAIRVSAASRPYVTVEAVSATSSTPIVRAPARVAFRDGAVSQVNMPLTGRVTEVHVKTGDRVKTGDPLVTLTSPDAAAARAQLAAAFAEHDAAVHETMRQDTMAKSGVGVDSERVAAQSKLRQSEAELARAQTTSSILGGGGGSVVVLRAPIDGTVITRRATVGAVAQPGGDPLIEIGNPTALWVIAEVFERDIAQVREGAEVDVELSTHAPLKGHVVSVGSALTGSLRTAPVFVMLDDATGARSGMFARAAIKAPAGQQSIVLPTEAVLVKDGKTYVVYVKIGDDLYAPRKVDIGPSVDGKVEVISGLKAGDMVITKGALLVDNASEQLL
ncbi:MAG TPA: efflux RND transporter periplasmic adaptor subunit [Kofleriaceae bacterium]|nr:efflux RND transporter periplasmic adaptor subunit [Kofleriaceae bacterium]